MSRYDIEKFDPAPDPDLVCCICQCVLDKAVECPCRHVFCQACIERWLTNRHTCPTCRKRTTKQDLQPVLPLVQNMLNRLLMICDFHENGCLEQVWLENFENHVKDCGYQMKTCRFIKCGQKILKKHLEQHETTDCPHRESLCGGECGLMIALSDRPTHNCMDALKSHIDEKNKMIDTLKSKLLELNNLSQSLNDQLEQLRQQLDNNNRDSVSFSDSNTDVTDFSDQDTFFEDSNDSFRYQLNGNIADASAANNNDISGNDGNTIDENDPANAVFEQVEVTVVNSLFDLSSQLERVRDEMRSVLNAGTVPDNSLTENLGMRSARFDDIIDNMSRNINDASSNSDTTISRMNAIRDVQNSTRPTANANVNGNRNAFEDMSENDDTVNNDTTNNNSPRSDHSYRGTSQSPAQNRSCSNKSKQNVDGSPTPSYRSDYSTGSLSDHSYSASFDRTPIRTRSIYTRSLTPLNEYSERNGRSRSRSVSRSPASERNFSVRNYSGRSLSTSPTDSLQASISSQPASSSNHSTPRSAQSFDGISQSDKSYRSYSSNDSATPRDFDGKSTGFQSHRSQSSWHWSSERGDSDRSQDVADHWSESLHHSDVDWFERSHDNGSDRSSSQREGEPSPAHSYSQYGSEEDRSSKSPTSLHSVTDNSAGYQSTSKLSNFEQLNKSSVEESSPRKATYYRPVTPLRPSNEESTQRQTSSPGLAELHYWGKDDSSGTKFLLDYDKTNGSSSDTSDSDSSFPRSRSRRQQKRNKCKRQNPAVFEFSPERQVEESLCRSSFENKTHPSKLAFHGDRAEAAGKPEVEIGARSDDKTSKLSQRTDTQAYSVLGSCIIGEVDNCVAECSSRSGERKRRIGTEAENSAVGDLRRSKRSKPATVGFLTPTPIHSQATVWKTSLPPTSTVSSNVNLKIDFSLFNITGQLFPSTTDSLAKEPANDFINSVITNSNTSQISLPPPAKSARNMHKNVPRNSWCRASNNSKTEPPNISNNKLSSSSAQERESKPQEQNIEKPQRQNKKLGVPTSQVLNSNGTNSRDFPNSWCDDSNSDSDSESDKTWTPGSNADKSDTDYSLREDEEILSDSSYEVLVPKTAASLLDEYKSDDTDDSWAPEDEC